jgi:hypothetical protein
MHFPKYVHFISRRTKPRISLNGTLIVTFNRQALCQMRTHNDFSKWTRYDGKGWSQTRKNTAFCHTKRTVPRQRRTDKGKSLVTKALRQGWSLLWGYPYYRGHVAPVHMRPITHGLVMRKRGFVYGALILTVCALREMLILLRQKWSKFSFKINHPLPYVINSRVKGLSWTFTQLVSTFFTHMEL